jgi:hypothetical protein
VRARGCERATGGAAPLPSRTEFQRILRGEWNTWGAVCYAHLRVVVELELVRSVLRALLLRAPRRPLLRLLLHALLLLLHALLLLLLLHARGSGGVVRRGGRSRPVRVRRTAMKKLRIVILRFGTS